MLQVNHSFTSLPLYNKVPLEITIVMDGKVDHQDRFSASSPPLKVLEHLITFSTCIIMCCAD